MSSKDKADEPLLRPEDVQGDLLDPHEQQKPASRPSIWRKVGSAARVYGRRLVEREAVTAEIPGLGEAVAAYETYRFSREVWDLIKEERALVKAAEESKKEISTISPYFKNEEIEANLGGFTKTGARVITKEHHERSIKPYRKDFYQGLPHYSFQIYEPSVEAVVSKAGSSLSAQKEEKFLLKEAAQVAKRFERNDHIGDANERYQYLIHNTIKHVGSDHYNRVYNPEAFIRLEKATVEQMHRDGYELQEIAHAYQKNSPFIRGLNDSQINRHAELIFDDVLHSKPLQESREAIARWRKEKGIPDSDRRTPGEFEYMRNVKIKAIQDQTQILRGEADKLLSTYRANPEMKLSTKEEYMIEEARYRAIGDHNNNDSWITTKLALARHEPAEIMKALQEASPHSTGNDYALKTINQASEFLDSAAGQNLTRTFEEYVAQNPQLYNETRLDKLGLDTKTVSSDLKNVTPHNQRDINANNLDKERDRPLR